MEKYERMDTTQFQTCDPKSLNENVFDFINTKLAFGVGEGEYYLTGRGDYIVNGPSFGYNWEECVDNYGLEDEITDEQLEDRSPEGLKYLESVYEKVKKEWHEFWNVNMDDDDTLELLHQQYLAIKEYSKDPFNEEARVIIKSTYEKTGINVLSYLRNLKTDDEWHKLRDFQGAQLCAVITGYDPLYVKEAKLRNEILFKQHCAFCHYIRKIDSIVSEKEKDINNGISKVKSIGSKNKQSI